MDFLANLKKKLEEMEEQARLLQAMEQAGLDKPKAKQTTKSGKGGAPKASTRHQVKPRGQLGALGLPREDFATPGCVTEAGLSPLEGLTAAASTLRPRLVDDLAGRLDEAFLLSEILGKPRCERDWDF